MGWAFRYWTVNSRAAPLRAPATCQLPDWSPGKVVSLW
jgi:hypothetical protein